MPVTEDLLADLNIKHAFDVPIGTLTWYHVGGPARVLAHPSSVAQLAALAARCHEQGATVYVLGSGANLLVCDGCIEGVVVRLDDPSFTQVKIEGNIITAGAGFDLFRLVLESAREGLGGLEVVAGIPASVGGAVKMNAGGAYGDIGSSVRRVQVMSTNGHVYYRDRDDLIFGYRQSNIVAPFILSVEFELVEEDPDQLMRRVKEIFLYKRNTQPLAEHSAGCAFKNPTPPGAQENDSPESSARDLPSAGVLIEQATLKGLRVGGAEVSSKHANFIITHAGCTAADVLALINRVQQTVHDRFGVTLEREVVVWP